MKFIKAYGWFRSLAIAAVTMTLGYHTALLAQPAPIKVGLLASFSGPAAAFGINMKTAVEMAISEINSVGGIGGRRLVLVSADDQTNPTAAVNEARRLVQQEKVNLMVGPLPSALVMAVLPIYTEAKIVSFTLAGTIQQTPEAGPYHFSMIANAESQGQATIDYFVDVLKGKSLAILSSNSPNDKDVLRFAKEAAAKRGVKIVGEQEIAIGAADVTPQMASLRRSNADAVALIVSTGLDTGRVIKARDELGWNVKLVGYTLANQYPIAQKVAGPNAYDNTVGMMYKGLTYCTGDAVGSAPYAKFLQKLKAFAPTVYADLTHSIVAENYDPVYIWKAAVEANGGKTDGPTLAPWIVANTAKLPNVSGTLRPSKDSSFFIKRDGLVWVDQYVPRSDGLMKQAGC